MNSNSERTQSIAIIGAGISGLITAYQLIENGYSVCIFEKENRVGGKLYTVNVDEDFIELGGVICPKIRYSRLHKLLKKFSISCGKLPLPMRQINAQAEMRPSIKEIFYFLKMQFQFKKKKQPFDSYMQSFASLAEKNHLCQIDKIISNTMFALGYGTTKTIPAWYIFKFIDLRMLVGTILPGKHSHYIKSGFQSVCQKLAEHIIRKGGKIVTQAEVKQITRTSENIEIHTDIITTHSAIIFSCSPYYIRQLPLELTSRESMLLQSVIYSHIVTILVEFEVSDNLSKNCYQFKSPHPEVAMIGIFPSRYKNRKYGVLYINPSQTGDFIQLANQDFEKQLAWYQKEIKLPKGWTFIKVIAVQDWPDYFAHFPLQRISFNPFEELKKLQSENRTFYVGGWCSFEIVESVIEHALTLVNHYFPVS